MKNYQIHMVYKDGEKINVPIEEKEIQKFFDSLNAAQVYKDPVSNVGFWTNLQDIRYITIVEKPKEENGPVTAPSDQCHEIVQPGDGDNQGREEAS